MRDQAQKAYNGAVAALHEYCEKLTDLEAEIYDDEFPFRVVYSPKPQMTIFDHVDGNGEVGTLVVTVGLTTHVLSGLKFKLESNQLKKLIKLSETVGNLYYKAYREQADNLPESEGCGDE